MKVKHLTIAKALVICTLFFLQAFTAMGHNWAVGPHQQLLQRLKQSKPDTNRILLLLGLAQQGYQKFNWQPKDMDSTYNFIKEAELLSIKLKSDDFLGNTATAFTRFYKKKKDYKKSIFYAQRALQLYTAANFKFGEAVAYYDLAQLCNFEGTDLEKKIDYLKKGLALLSNSQTETHAQHLIALGNAQTVRGENEEALTHFNEALAIYKAIGHTALQYIYSDWANILENMDDGVGSLKYRLLALKTAEGQNDTTEFIGELYNGVGMAYSGLNDYKNADFYHIKALAVARKYKDSSRIAASTGERVDALIQQNKTAEALTLLKDFEKMGIDKDDRFLRVHTLDRFQAIYRRMKNYALCKEYLEKEKPFLNDPDYRYVVVGGLLQYYLATGQYRLCYPYLLERQAYFQKHHYINPEGGNELFFFRVDSGSGKYQSAIRHYQRYMMLTERYNDIKKNKQVTELQQVYNRDKKLLQQNNDILLLKKQSQLQAQKTAANRNMLLAGAGILLILLAIAYNRYRAKQRHNRQLQTKQDEINNQYKALEELLTEKDWLLKEVHHRVKNNLQIVMSLLSTQSAYLQNSDAIDAIRESQNRVQSISLIHQKLYSGANVASIDMPAYVTDLIGYLRDCFDTQQRRIRFEQLVEPIKMDLAQAVPLGLILNEAITNAIKYAFAENGGEVIIALQLIGADTVMLTIADNGKGLPDDFDIKTASSLGMEMMKALSKQLGGTFEIKNQGGTTISIEFQLEKILSGSQTEKNYI